MKLHELEVTLGSQDVTLALDTFDKHEALEADATSAGMCFPLDHGWFSGVVANLGDLLSHFDTYMILSHGLSNAVYKLYPITFKPVIPFIR